MFAGREATQAEIDELARTLLERDARDVTIVAEQHFDRRPETGGLGAPDPGRAGTGDRRGARSPLSDWAQTRIAERHIELEEV